MIATRAIGDRLHIGDLGSTFGGGPYRARLRWPRSM
jgi:hypothetical protein